MKALIYRDFSESYKIKEIGTGKIKDVLPEYPEDRYAVLVNGARRNGDYEINDGDAVIVRAIPHATGVLIASLVVAGAGAIVGGVAAYKAKKQAQRAQEEAERLSESLKNSGGSVDADPTMPGASNTVATGKTQPFVMGRRLWTPYFLTSEWDSLRGSYWQEAVEGSFNAEITLTVTEDKVETADDEDTYNFNGYYYKLKVEFLSDWDGAQDVNVMYGSHYDGFEFTIKKGETYTAGQTINARFYDGRNRQRTDIRINGQRYYFNGLDFDEEETSSSVTVNFPVITSEAHYEKDNTEYNYRVLQAGFADQAIEEIRADDEVLVKFNPPATSADTFLSSTLFPDSRLEIRQNGEAFKNEKFSFKMDVQETGTELKLSDDESYSDLEYTVPVNTKSIYIPLEFPSGLYTTNDNGSRSSRKIETLVQYSTDGGTTYKNLQTQFGKNGAVEDNNRSDLYFVLEHTFTDAEILYAVKNGQPVKIKISCLTPKTENGNTCDNMQIVKIRSRLIDEKKARTKNLIEYAPLLDAKIDALSVKIGLCLKATATNKDKASKIQIVTCGMARTWDKTSREWSEEKKATRNPAAWLLEVLTSRTHPASRLSDDEIDLESLGDFYEYCDENALNIDLVISTGDTKENILKKILETGNAGLYRSIYGKLAVAIDDKKTNAVAILNQQNLISFSAEKNLTRNVDGYRVTFTESGYWKEDTQVFMRDGSDYADSPADVQIEELKIDSFTADSEKGDFSQVYKSIRRKINADILRAHTFTLEIGKEGYFFPLFSKIKIQHPALYTGLGSSTVKRLIVSGQNIIALELYSPVQYSAGERYGAVIQCVNKNYSRILNAEYTAESGESAVINLVNPIPVSAETVPSADNILSFGLLSDDGSFQTITSEMTVTEIKPTTSGYRLTGVDYSDALFDYGAIPRYRCSLSKPRGPLGTQPLTNDDLLKKTDEIKGELEKLVSVDVVNSVQSPADVSSCSGIAEKNGITLSAVAGGSTIFDNVKNFVYQISRDAGKTWQDVDGEYYSFGRTKDGYPEKSAFVNWLVRSKAKNSYNVLSENWKEGSVSASSNYKTWILSAPKVSAKAYEGRIEISLNDETNANVWGFKSYSLSYTDAGGKCKSALVKKDDWNYTLSIAGLCLEKSDIARITFTAKVSTEADAKTAQCNADTSEYLTYVPSVPEIALSVSGRSVALSFSHKEFYEFSGYALQVSKDGKSWFSYGEDDYDRDSENKWKGEADGRTGIPGSYKAFFLSLEGETENTPQSTGYYFRALSYGAETGGQRKESGWSGAEYALAAATLARDIVANAITNNKLAEGAVTADKIAAGTITADELYAGDLAAGGASFGKITSGGNGISGDANNFWDLEKNEFRVGNDITLENTDTGLPKADNSNAWYFHYKESFGLALSLAKFVVTSIASIIKGVFKIQTNAGADFVRVNPESTEQSDIAAKTFNVDGTVSATNVKAAATLQGNSISSDTTVTAKSGITAGGNVTASDLIASGKSAVRSNISQAASYGSKPGQYAHLASISLTAKRNMDVMSRFLFVNTRCGSEAQAVIYVTGRWGAGKKIDRAPQILIQWAGGSAYNAGFASNLILRYTITDDTMSLWLYANYNMFSNVCNTFVLIGLDGSALDYGLNYTADSRQWGFNPFWTDTLQGEKQGTVAFADAKFGTVHASLDGTASRATGIPYTGENVTCISAQQQLTPFNNSAAEWASYIICNHGNGKDYYHQMIRLPFFSDTPQLQRRVAGALQGWRNFAMEGNSVSFNGLTASSATIGGRAAITGTTSTDSNGNLVLNLYTN